MNAPAASPPPSRQANPYVAPPTNQNNLYGAAPQAAAAQNRYGAGPAAQAPPADGYGPAANAPSDNPYLPANPAAEQNRYAMPSTPGQNPLATDAGPSTRSNPPAGQPASRPPADRGAAQAAPEFGLEGYCPVTLMEAQKWTPGDRRWGAVHRGVTYLFVGKEEQQKFLADPDRYSPAMSGVDPVLALEQGQRVPGRRRHGVYYHDHIYLFSSEATLARFSQDPQHFAEGVRQAMRQPAPGDVQRR
jgi:YHS domain-containing protein